jgi:hypothetical protein
MRCRKPCQELAAFPGARGLVFPSTSKSTLLERAWERKGDAELTKAPTAHSYLSLKVSMVGMFQKFSV